MGTPEDIYNEPTRMPLWQTLSGRAISFPASCWKISWWKFWGTKFPCVDVGFREKQAVDVVIRPEDVDLLAPEEGIIQGVVSHLIFKGVHYEMEVQANGFEWLVHSTDMFPVGQKVGIHVNPFDIQIMHKPESEDEEAIGVNE